jgi:hypothetical protein
MCLTRSPRCFRRGALPTPERAVSTSMSPHTGVPRLDVPGKHFSPAFRPAGAQSPPLDTFPRLVPATQPACYEYTCDRLRGWKLSQRWSAHVKESLILGMLPAEGPLAGFLHRPQAGFRRHVSAGEKCSQVSHSRSFIIQQPSSNPQFCLTALVRARRTRAPLFVCL